MNIIQVLSLSNYNMVSTLSKIFLQPRYELFYNSIDIEFDDITMKTKLVVRPSIIAIRFDELSFFSNTLDFAPHWDYKHYNEYISQKIVILKYHKKVHLECDVIDGSVVNDFRLPLLYSFVLDKPAGNKVFSQPETVRYKEIKKIF